MAVCLQLKILCIRGQKTNDHLGATLKISYFVFKEQVAVEGMAVWVQFSKLCISF